MTKENVSKHWNLESSAYQKRHKISTDYVHFGPSCPTEEDLNLLGDVRGKKIIELGCGGAQCSIALSKKGAICTGVDLSEEQLEFAKKISRENNVKIKFIHADIQNLEMISDNNFDIAFSAFAFDWVQNLHLVFQETKRILKEEGIFVFSMQHPVWTRFCENPKDLTLKTSYFERKELYKEPTGITIEFCNPTIGDLINNLIKTGFTIERVLEPEPVDAKFGDYEEAYPREALKMIPATIIFKARKKNS